MTTEEIIELFIKSAAVDRGLPKVGGPARLKAANLGFVYSDEDRKGWDDKEVAPTARRLSTNDIGLWEAAMDVIKLVPNVSQRRALWQWASSKSGGKSFAKWCKNVEHILPATGDYRRKRAIHAIAVAFDCSDAQHSEKVCNEHFTSDLEIGDKEFIIRNDVPKAWMAVDARPMACDFDADLQSFDWAAVQNSRRREREARKAA